MTTRAALATTTARAQSPAVLRHMSSSTSSSDEEQRSVFTVLTTYFGFATLTLFGYLRDLVGRLTGKSRYVTELRSSEDAAQARIVRGWERFYTRRMFNRIQDCWSRPVVGRPSTWITLAERCSTDGQKTMETHLDIALPRQVLNLGSYNYLGFADDDWNATCGEQVRAGLKQWGVAVCAGPSQIGTTTQQMQLERVVAAFVGKEDAVVFGTGYATNAWAIPILVGKGSLIVSDALNHMSIVNGCRASGAVTQTFAHNDADDLERVLKRAVMQDAPAYDKILVICEGLYSMEGHTARLRNIVHVCKRYKAFLYVDEAHSIGALGATGRGICELEGVDPAQVDVLMGTFTKSFGGLGGYVASSKPVCDQIRACLAAQGRSAMSPVVAAQVLRAFHLLDCTQLGKDKLARLQSNALFFRRELEKMGCTVLGDDASPIIPVMLYHPTKIAAFSRECLKRSLAVVVVGAPAVPMDKSRARFCVSASHTREDLRWALVEIRAVSKLLNLRYERSAFG